MSASTPTLELLSAVFKHDTEILLAPGTAEYEEETCVYWNVANREIRPQAIVRPKTSEEAATAVKLLAEANIEFGVRSAGAMPNAGFNNSRGVLIVTTYLNATIEFPRDGIARIGSGTRWATVYEKLLESGNTCVGTRSTLMACGGSLLGGGLSHLSGEHGFAADNVVRYEVVLGSGELVEATAEVNPDLFWALKGGGNNYGLVTRYDVKIVPQKGGIWGGLITIDSKHQEEAMQALYDFQTCKEYRDVKAAMEMITFRGTAFGGLDNTIPVILLYYGAPVENPPALKPFMDLPIVHSTLRLTTHLDLIGELSKGTTKNFRHTFYTGTFQADAGLCQAGHDIFFEAVKEAGLADDISLAAFTSQPVPASMLGRSNPMGLSAEGAPYIWWNMAIEYKDSEDAKILEIMHRANDRLTQKAKSVGKHHPFIFLNDAGYDQDPFQSYGAENFARMKAIRDKYDPKGVFTKLCVGGFKLGA